MTNELNNAEEKMDAVVNTCPTELPQKSNKKTTKIVTLVTLGVILSCTLFGVYKDLKDYRRTPIYPSPVVDDDDVVDDDEW